MIYFRYTIYFLIISCLLFSCKEEDDSNSETPENSTCVGLKGDALLVSKIWESVKVINSGMDVTSQVSEVTYDFKSDGTYTASASSGSPNGTWTRSETNLVLNGNTWKVLEFNANSLKIDYSNGAIVIYFK